jgi:hypothetical protein
MAGEEVARWALDSTKWENHGGGGEGKAIREGGGEESDGIVGAVEAEGGGGGRGGKVVLGGVQVVPPNQGLGLPRPQRAAQLSI